MVWCIECKRWQNKPGIECNNPGVSGHPMGALSDPLGLEESGSPPCIFGIHDQSTVRTVHSLWYILLPVYQFNDNTK